MKKDYTHITFILDRTGSMQEIKDETISGFNYFLDKQKKEDGLASMLLVQFDSEDSFEIINDFSNISDVKPLNKNTFQPRGLTPLLDTIGEGILHTEKEINKLPSNQKPELVIMAILTDGKENASHRFNKSQIKSMIDEKQLKGWRFIFLGANMDAVSEAGSMGFDPGLSMTFSANSTGTTNAYHATTTLVSNLRSGNVNYTYTDKDREDALCKN